MNHSPQQQAVIDHVRTQPGSAVVDAVAGSGKTTAIVEAAFQAPDPTTLICAFNRRIADELTAKIKLRKVPRTRMIIAKTLHSLGLQIIRDNRGGAEPDFEATDALVRETSPSASFPLRRAIVQTVRFLKETCTPWENQVELTATISSLGTADSYGQIAEIVLGVQSAMAASIHRRPSIDFCDMIYLPHALDLPARGRFRLIVVDEFQDLNLGQFYLIERLLAPGGRIIVVGDLQQQIYDFRGADGRTLWKRMQEKHNAITLPLTWSFRCPRQVVALARTYASKIEPAPSAPEGIVDEQPMTEALSQIAIGDFFLSRSNAGCVSAAIRAHIRGASVRVLGGYEVVEPILELLKKLDTSKADRFTKSLMEWHTKEQAKENITDEQAERATDRFNLLSEAVKLVEPRNLNKMFREIFRDGSEPAAIFSTVHKAKGLEADHVFLLKKSFSLFRRNREGRYPIVADLSEEERNILYVAVTRSMRHLTWVVDDGDACDDVARFEDDTDLETKLNRTITEHINKFGNRPNDEDITREDIDAGLRLPDEEP